MATLTENIAKTKENFRNIRDAINVVGDVAGFNNLTTESVEEYPTRLNEAVDHYGLSRYEDGYADGKADGGGGVDLSKCKYIPKQATGKVISLNDVSEVYHKVKVYGDGKVDVYGKNLFDISTDTRFTQQEDGSYINSVTIGSTVKNPLNLPHNAYKLSYDMSCPVGVNARIRVNYKDGTYIETLITSTGDFVHFETAINGEVESWNVYYSSQPKTETLIIKNAQIEVGSIATAHEPYNKQTITATPMGTEVSSICPNMTFIADNDIAVDYYSSFGMAEKELAMWNAFTVNGKRENYTYAWGYNDYSGYAIPLGMCKPKISMAQMFYNYQGVELPRGIDCSGFDISTTTQTYHCYNTFAYAYNLIHIYDIGIPAVKFYTATFRGCSKLKSIEIIRCNEQTVFDTNCFNGCTSLTHCIFSGVIANDLNTQWCPFDDESLMSLGDTVIDLYSSGLGEGSRTLTLSDKCKQRLQELQHSTLGSYFDYIVAYKGWKIT